MTPRKQGRPRVTDAERADRRVAARAFQELRLARGLTQLEVGRACRVGAHAVSNWESGTRRLPRRAVEWMLDSGEDRA